MPKYETMLITSATLDEEAAVAVVEKFKTLISANGEIDGVEEWGKRRLAYPINKENDGVYTLIHFTSGPDFPSELDRVYKITDGVLRSLIIAKLPGQEYVPPSAEDVAARERAAAETAAAVDAAKPAAAEPAVEQAAPEAVAEEPAAEEAVATEEAAEPAAEPAAEETAEAAAPAEEKKEAE